MAFTDRVFYRTGAARKSGIWTTTTSSHLSGPGATPITITVADASLFPRGAGVSEDCLLSVCSSENQNTVLDILYDVAISGNSVTCKREYGNAIPEGSIMLVGAPAELLDELKTELSGKEDSFGNPTSDGGVLTSTTGGVRSWVGQDTLPPFLRSEADYIVAASGGDYTTPQALMTALGNFGAVGKKIWVDSTIATPAANQNILSGDWYWDHTACDFDTNQNSLSFRGISRHWGQVAVTGPGAATTANLFVMVESPQIYAEVVINHTRTVPPSAAWRAFETATLRGAYAKLVHIATAPATDFNLISVNAAYILTAFDSDIGVRVSIDSPRTAGSNVRRAVATLAAAANPRTRLRVEVDTGLNNWEHGVHLDTDGNGIPSGGVFGRVLSGDTAKCNLANGVNTTSLVYVNLQTS
jgi:hypothetical protein